MSDILTWENLRLVNFVILFACFMVMMYKGIYKMVLYRKSFEWHKFMNLAWTLLALYSIGEVLAKHTPGGARVIVQTVVALLQLWVAVCRYGEKYAPVDRLEKL